MKVGRYYRHIFILCSLVFMSACAPLDTSNRDVDLQFIAEKNSVSIDDTFGETAYSQRDFVLSPGDTVEVKYLLREGFNDTYKIRRDGRITLPFLGSILVSGKTPETVQAEIRQAYIEWMERELSQSQNKQYLIQVADQLQIRFPYNDELDQAVVVRPDGRISLPLVGTVTAIGKTPEALAQELISAYKQHLKEPNLAVIVTEFSESYYYVDGMAKLNSLKGLEEVAVIVRDSKPQNIFVGGEVQVPGVFAYNGPISALQAIIMAGGQKITGEMRQVVVIRKEGDRPRLMFRNLEPELNSHDSPSDMPVSMAALGDVKLQPNDVVIVPKSNIAKIGLYVDQYLFDLFPVLRNSSFGFIYDVNPTDEITSITE